MSGPEQPWWARPGGAPLPGGTPQPGPRAPRPEWAPPPRQPSPSQQPRHHARPAPPPSRAPQPPSHPKPTPQPYGRRLHIGAAIAVAAVAVIGVGLWVWSRSDVAGTRLDVRQAEAGVAQILSDPINGYGANRIVAVACNDGKNPVVRTGATFTCAVEINDTLRRVIVEFTDDNGTYAVDGPR
ncbi:DUF4333 domain-containing protein [Mycolicibacterium sp. 050232]|uniref:DUF4333 domain-containing protein n=1 Tax=Mycolicibacterium sp. 050232 TaxID=3113982 RepID=UPI002E28BFB4|nr:DUF4333 domain-containing protein [Mycolicibacterium sp. 050232]MED5813435.1 DUF4333 domain-containing protein [Mycolicibacterium sp. 050232]